MGLNGLSKEYILMSIKPHYADLIYTERKRFEYRKRAPKLVDLLIRALLNEIGCHPL